MSKTDNNKPNNGEIKNENISFVTDEDALTEIDLGSFLEESSKAAPMFEGFHEDIEKTEKSLESELQSLYDDIMSSGPATIVPKPLSVITEAEEEKSEPTLTAESGLNELWMAPEEYMDLEIPVVSLDDADAEEEEEVIPEEAFFKPEEPIEAPHTSEDTKNDIFGMIDSMKNSTEGETGFGDILAEIESNSEIAPLGDDYDSIAGFLSTLPVSEELNASETETATIEPIAEEEPENFNAEVTVEDSSDDFDSELSVLLGDDPIAPSENIDDNLTPDFVVNIPDDGNDYSFATAQNDASPLSEPVAPFSVNSATEYESAPVPEQAERVVIGDFEAAQRAALEATQVKSKQEIKAEKKEAKKNGEKQPISGGEIARRIVLTLSILVIIASGVILVNTYLIQPNLAKKLINDTGSVLENGMDVHGDALIDSNLSGKYDVEFPNGMLAKYAQLYASNTDLRGWISIPAFEINLPLVQGDDNDYYLKRNIYKKWTEYGVPFFDYRIAENQFSDLPRNTVIYGHNMRSDDLIFGMLEEYRDIDGFKRAPVIECNTIYGDYTWLVCGVFISNSQEKHDNGYVFPYNFIDCSDRKFADYITELEKRRFYDTGVDLAPTDKILTLSTCCYDFEDARLVVVARLLRDGESVSVDTSKAIKNPDPKGPQAWCDSIGKPNNYAYDVRW